MDFKVEEDDLAILVFTARWGPVCVCVCAHSSRTPRNETLRMTQESRQGEDGN